MTCAECGHIGPMSVGQAFAKCRYWAGRAGYEMVPEEWRADAFAYACLHCHVMPHQPACPAVVTRKETCCA